MLKSDYLYVSTIYVEINYTMRPEYDGVKFYSVMAGVFKEHLVKVAVIFDLYGDNKRYIDANEVINYIIFRN